jgi:hypothetical protein
MIVGIVVGALVALLAGSVAVALVDEGDPPRRDASLSVVDSGTDTGGNSELHDQCADGDLEACDELYTSSPPGSAEEDFGSTCGDTRGATRGGCSADFEADSFGSSLRSECADGDMAACDALYLEADYGSADEYFGSTCGGRTYETEGGCDD